MTEIRQFSTLGMALARPIPIDSTRNGAGLPETRERDKWRATRRLSGECRITMRSGFDVIQQKIFGWGELPIDCITVLRRNG
jgi:hypothetical protein